MRGHKKLASQIKQLMSHLNDAKTRLHVCRTEHLKAEQIQKKLSDDWAVTFNAVRDVIFLVNKKSEITKANSQAALFFNKPVNELIGKKCYKLIHGKNAPAKLCPIKKVTKTKKRMELEFYLKAKNIYVRVSVDPILDSGGNVIGAIHIVRDITNRVKIEQALKESEKKLKEDKNSLAKKLEKKIASMKKYQKQLEDARRLSDIGTVTATVAHELKNPLGVIKTAVYNIKRKNRNPLLEPHLANIDKKIAESDQIIKNISRYSRINEPYFEAVHIPDILNECLNHARAAYAGWDVQIQIKSNHKKNKMIVQADPVHITELFANIIDNAFQALPDKKGKIKINLTRYKKDNKLNISFKDNGTGISSKYISRIFEPFFTLKAKGLGLGLTVCKQVLRLHKGEINVLSSPGQGAEFSITLPIKQAAYDGSQFKMNNEQLTINNLNLKC